MKPLIVILGAALGISAAYAAHDVTCRAVINPQDEFYVQVDSAIVPKLSIANLGNQAEIDIWVKLIVVVGDPDTVYLDSVLVDHLHPYPDTLEIEFPEWTPEGLCKDYIDETSGPFVWYELYGVTALEGDENPANDTAKGEVTSVFAHNVGAIDYQCPEEPDYPPDRYLPGSKLTFTATVENFGFKAEQDVHIRMEVRDVDSNNVLIWTNVRNITFLDWRGNPEGNPHTVDMTFPPFTVPNEHHFSPEFRTEMEGDQCPDDDFCVRHINGPPDTDYVAEDKTSVARINIELSGADKSKISFTLPQASRVRLDVFDATGSHVKTLADNVCQAGEHQITWNGRNDESVRVPSGVYFIRMEAGRYRQTRRFVLAR